MPRIIVTSDPSRLPDHVAILLDERVETVHLASDHAAAQLVERIAWAISDAEDTEAAWATAQERPGTSVERFDRRDRAGRSRSSSHQTVRIGVPATA